MSYYNVYDILLILISIYIYDYELTYVLCNNMNMLNV